MNDSGAGFPRSSTKEKAEENGAPPASGKVPAPRELCPREQGTDREQWMLPGTHRPRQGSRGNSRGERHAVLEEEPRRNAALIPLQRRAVIPRSGAQPANSERWFPRSHSGLPRATVPPASVSTVTGWLQLPAPLLIISHSGINIRI